MSSEKYEHHHLVTKPLKYQWLHLETCTHLLNLYFLPKIVFKNISENCFSLFFRKLVRDQDVRGCDILDNNTHDVRSWKSDSLQHKITSYKLLKKKVPNTWCVKHSWIFENEKFQFSSKNWDWSNRSPTLKLNSFSNNLYLSCSKWYNHFSLITLIVTIYAGSFSSFYKHWQHTVRIDSFVTSTRQPNPFLFDYSLYTCTNTWKNK